jgi:hypothetical protein
MGREMSSYFFGLFKKWLRCLQEKNAQHQLSKKHEDAMMNEIERILSETKTRIPELSHYRKRLKEPLHTAWMAIDGMMAHIPGPIDLNTAGWGNSPVLNAIFTSPDEFSSWLNSCSTLLDAFKKTTADELFGLLAAEYNEKSYIGVGRMGDIVLKDVLQKSIYFEDPRILVPQPDLETAKREVQHRILVMLFTLELKEIADLKALTKELEKQKEILKILLRRRKKHSKREDDTEKGAKQIISDIDKKIDRIGRNPDSAEGHLQHVIEALMNIEQHLKITPLVLRLNNLGIEVGKSSSEPFDEISFAEVTYTGEPRRTIIWAHVNRASLQSI